MTETVHGRLSGARPKQEAKDVEDILRQYGDFEDADEFHLSVVNRQTFSDTRSEMMASLARQVYAGRQPRVTDIGRYLGRHSDRESFRNLVILAHRADPVLEDSEASPLPAEEAVAVTAATSSSSKATGAIVPRVHRALWFSLVAIALLWGLLTGASLAADGWLDPASALFGVLAVGVLGLTLNKLGQRRRA